MMLDDYCGIIFYIYIFLTDIFERYFTLINFIIILLLFLDYYYFIINFITIFGLLYFIIILNKRRAYLFF